MTRVLRIRVETYSGTPDLCRVINVLALMDVMPFAFTGGALPEGPGLWAWFDLHVDQRRAILTVARIGALACVKNAELSELGANGEIALNCEAPCVAR